jgi:hypothetical protein
MTEMVGLILAGWMIGVVCGMHYAVRIIEKRFTEKLRALAKGGER